MNLKVGDLLADFEVLSSTGKDLFLEDPKNLIIQYIYGIVCDITDIEQHDDYDLSLLHLNKDRFKDNKCYSILWADFDEPVKYYYSDQIEQFKNNIKEIEKQIENDKLK